MGPGNEKSDGSPTSELRGSNIKGKGHLDYSEVEIGNNSVMSDDL